MVHRDRHKTKLKSYIERMSSMYMKIPPIESMENAFSVKGKNVVVTGGNRGIGLGIATAFAQSGANVVILCRNYESGSKVAEEFAKYGGKYACYACDISDFAMVKTAVAKVFEFFDNVDVLVNNAGVASTTPFLNDENLSEWHRIINTNLHGVAHVVHTVAPKMVEAKRGGCIINISSIGGQRVGNAKNHPNPPYNVSKAGLDIFSKYLAAVLGDDGIRVHVISPGLTHSDLDKDLPPETFEMAETRLPTHRFGEPIEIGALCVFLASPAAVQMHGNVIQHDGGALGTA